MQLASNDGCDALKTAWLSMPESMQNKMKNIKASLWASAQAIDEMKIDVEIENHATTAFDPAKTVEQKPAKKQKKVKPEPTNEEIINKF